MSNSKRISLVVLGTRGDFQPCMALALGLLKQNVATHVTFLSSPNYIAQARSWTQISLPTCSFVETKDVLTRNYDADYKGNATQQNSMVFEYQHFAADPEFIMNHPSTQEALSTGDVSKFLSLSKQPEFAQDKPLQRKQIIASAKGSLMILVNSMIWFEGIVASLYHKIKCVLLVMNPYYPTRDLANFLICPDSPEPCQENLDSWIQMFKAGASYANSEHNTFLTSLGLDPIQNELGMMGEYVMSGKFPLIVCCSQNILKGGKHPLDYPPHVHMTSFLSYASAQGSKLEDSIQAFLTKSKNKPVFLGFGSMPVKDLQKLSVPVINQVREQFPQQSFIVASGWSKNEQHPSMENVLHIREAPYDLLFPQCSCIVHHGGSGTTSSALLSKNPQVVIPFFADQPFFAHQMHKIGVAPKPFHFKDATPEAISQSIIYVLTNQNNVTQKASEIGDIIASENGIDASVNLIKDMMK